MQQELMAKAMLAMGWDPNSDLPMANEENALLLNEVLSMVGEKAALDELQQQTLNRLHKIQQHSKNAEISLNQNLNLLAAHQSEVQTELHLYKLADREESKLKEDLKKTNKEFNNFKSFVDTTEKELCKRKIAVDNLTNRIQWAKTALIEWTEAMEAGNKGYQLIEKYFKEDQVLANQKNQRRQLLQNKIQKGRKELVELYDKQKSLEQNLECTANLYRSAHLERRHLIETWKTAVHQMLQREHDIHAGEKTILELQPMSKKVDDERRRRDQKLTDIIAINKSVEQAIEELNTDTSEIKEQIQILINMVILKENEMELLQKELQNLSNRVQQQRAENRNNAREKADKLQMLEDFKEILRKLHLRLKNMQHQNLSGQQRLQMLEELNDAEDKAQNHITKETTRVNGLMYRSQTQLTDLKDSIKILEMNNSGTAVTIQAILQNNKKLEKDLLRETETHYNLSFKCLQFERRIIKLQGGVVDPEEEQRNLALIAVLENDLAVVHRRLAQTEAQNKKLDDSMRTLTDVYNNDLKKLEVMSFKTKEAQAYCEGGVKRLKVERQTNQILIVELSILKMRANEFETEIAATADSTFNLEKHRLQLNRVMKDRMIQLKSQMDLLNLKRKHLSEEKSTLLADIGERNKHINVVKARFELTSKLLGTNEDGTIVTATQLRVESAQEKQLLLDEGNELNAKVLKAEEEIKAMENTLMLLNNSNDNFRKNLSNVDDDIDTKEFKKIHDSYCQSLTQLKALRNRLLKAEQENDRTLKQKADLDRQLEVISKQRLATSEIHGGLKKELSEQEEKLSRAERDLKMTKRALKARAMSPEFIQQYDRELDLRELEYRNSKALNQLSDFAENDDEVGPTIIKVLDEKGLKMPHQLQKTRSFASWRSGASDISNSSTRDLILSSRSSTTVSSNFTVRTSMMTIQFAG